MFVEWQTEFPAVRATKKKWSKSTLFSSKNRHRGGFFRVFSRFFTKIGKNTYFRPHPPSPLDFPPPPPPPQEAPLEERASLPYSNVYQQFIISTGNMITF